MRRLGVHANADTPADALKARELGAEGIGLCRTEHMFMAEERLPVVREMIMAADERERRAALDKLLPMQQADFEGIFEAMAGLPVTIRLLDPPLHEFLPPPEDASDEQMRERINALHETNPMLGTRGCRLGLQWPEIYEMQVRAIVRAAKAVAGRTGAAPQGRDHAPARRLRRGARSACATLTARTVAEEGGIDYACGTMIELPRACVRADEIAEHADFFSFGTNDLTQTALGFSRDDAEGTFLARYLERANPRARSRSRRSISRASATSCASRSSAAARHDPISGSASAASTEAIRRRSTSATGWASTTSRARPTAFRWRGSWRHRPRWPRQASATTSKPAVRWQRGAEAAVFGDPRRTRREVQVFVTATSVVSVQLVIAGAVDLDEGALGPGLACWLLAALAPASWWIFTRASRPFAAVLCAAIGLAASCAGLAVYGFHAALAGPAMIDVTGLLATAAGLVLLALGFRIALAGRRRLVQALLGIPAAFVIAQWGFVPIVGAGLATNTGHPTIPSARTLGLAGARDVQFEAGDGTSLTGWFVPGRTRAAVVLLHGSHGTRRNTETHLRMLVHAGFAVLAFDARGHGDSGGSTNALGWSGASDIAGAVAFVRRQPRIDSTRIAAFGLSMGAEEALRAAAGGVPLAAVVADGAGASTLGDQRLVTHGLAAPIALSSAWLLMREAEILSGTAEPPPLEDIVGRIRVPVLLVASGAAGERVVDEAFRSRIGAQARLWYLPDTAHTRGLAAHREQYTIRATRFLDAALAP